MKGKYSIHLLYIRNFLQNSFRRLDITSIGDDFQNQRLVLRIDEDILPIVLVSLCLLSTITACGASGIVGGSLLLIPMACGKILR